MFEDCGYGLALTVEVMLDADPVLALGAAWCLVFLHEHLCLHGPGTNDALAMNLLIEYARVDLL